MELDVIVICQDDVSKRCGDVARRQKFFSGRGKGHRCAGIDKYISEEIDLFAKQFDVEPVGARIDTPIQVAKIIPRRVSAIIGKLQARTPPRRGVTPGLTTEELLSRAQPKSFQLAEIL
jgi:hypothetical protein